MEQRATVYGENKQSCPSVRAVIITKQFDLQYSIKKHLAEKTGYKIVWIYDGVTLPDMKPFITIEQMPSSTAMLAKLRETVRTIYHFQVGVYANSATERAAIQEKVRKIFLFDRFKLIDANDPSKELGLFCVDMTAETPISAEDLSDKTNYHRVFFDIEVDATYQAY
ncbi:hypothetical protein [Bacillus sonorensis]|uniref:hypothetical protein n=1 Tax=Bacillus sonorensis TaxID=119858 RepID=UPI00142E2D50|nr:hypothetical protein [Bacillus sonorensis]WPP37724.1 hypothetical protein SK061_05730 [Bacillus sonorensis]